ncbi:MAG: sulfite exporter TauE/SafE family protein, partial [Alphaproteobacteria bacterium]|nr:sulfite exporter TauE/SafE family protein [Alphaproteobacteria bacterium]
GFATGLLAASIAVGGFIGVPAMIYVLGVPAIMATATELVVAFVMGAGGSLLYAWDGYVDIRLAMIILAGSLFGVQIGAIGTTYVKDWVVKLIMATIMLIVLVSRFFKVPVYLSNLDLIEKLPAATSELLSNISFGLLALALLTGAVSILVALVKGMAEDKRAKAEAEAAAAAAAAEPSQA